MGPVSLSAEDTPSPTPDPHLNDPLGGTELTLGDPVDLPDGVAVIEQLSRPSPDTGETLVRIRRGSDGQYKSETIFDTLDYVDMRQVSGSSVITGLVASPDGHEIFVGVCIEGSCFNPIAPKLVRVYRSTDGGQSWAGYFEVNGPAGLVAWTPTGVIVSDDMLYTPNLTRFPSGQHISLPFASEPFALGDGTLLFAALTGTNDIVHSDGSLFVQIPNPPQFSDTVSSISGSSEAQAVIIWDRPYKGRGAIRRLRDKPRREASLYPGEMVLPLTRRGGAQALLIGSGALVGLS